MAGVGGALYAATLGGVRRRELRLLRRACRSCCWRSSAASAPRAGALFAGDHPVGLPLVIATVAALAEPLNRCCPAPWASASAATPTASSATSREQFQPLWQGPRRHGRSGRRRSPGCSSCTRSDVISGWNFGIVAVLCTFAAPLVAEVAHARCAGSAPAVRSSSSGRPSASSGRSPTTTSSRSTEPSPCPRSESPMALLEVSDVTVRFGGHQALDVGGLRRGAGHGHRADRSERRRQDHPVQRHLRPAVADAAARCVLDGRRRHQGRARTSGPGPGWRARSSASSCSRS